MEKVKQSIEVYDRIYEEGGYQAVYNLPYRHSAYFPLFRNVLEKARARRASRILEVGCGTGGFAHLLMDESDIAYRGFDFSPVAVQRARARTGATGAFYTADATTADAYMGEDYDCVVCTEVLEHVEEDLKCVANWRGGAYCICSVPNFDCETHVRFFRTAEEVIARYGGLIDIESVVRIKKPVLSDISIRSVLRALRWNRYRPVRMMEILGIGSFDDIGGWFLFSGTKR